MNSTAAGRIISPLAVWVGSSNLTKKPQ